MGIGVDWKRVSFVLFSLFFEEEEEKDEKKKNEYCFLLLVDR